jgi:hypothetical protein
MRRACLSVGSRSGICSYMDHGGNFCMSTMSTSFSLPHYMQAHEETSSET